MNLDEIFSHPIGHLKALGIKATYKIGAKCREDELADAELKIGSSIPDDLRKLYLKSGNGAEFSWQESEDDNCHKFANLSIPDLESLIDLVSNWREKRFWSWTAKDFAGSSDPKLAKQTVQRMKNWLPLFEEGNGDKFCIEIGDPRPSVVFHQHDWNDGGNGVNGLKVANSLGEFLQQWSKVCFLMPSNLWWPSVIGVQGINWSSEKFDERYHLDPKK